MKMSEDKIREITVKITLIGEGNCSIVIDCSKKEYHFLKKIEGIMGEIRYEPYSPAFIVEKLKEK